MHGKNQSSRASQLNQRQREAIGAGLEARARKTIGRARIDPKKRMDRVNAYTRSLENPFAEIGAVIPDSCVYNTGVVRMVRRFNISAVEDASNSGKFQAGVLINSWRPQGCLNTLVGVNGGTIAWSPEPNVEATTLAFGGSMSGISTLRATAQRLRVVSAAVVAEPSMSSLNDQGNLIAANLPGTNPNNGTTGFNAKNLEAFSSAQTLAVFGAIQSPVKEGGACVCYKPVGPDSFAWTNVASTVNGADAVGKTGVIAPYYGGAIILFSGVSSLFTATVSVVINLEVIPRSSALSLISTGPSLPDSMALDHALTYVAYSPAAETGEKAVEKANGVVREGHMALDHPHEHPSEPSIFGTLKSMGSTILNAIPKILPLVAEML